MRHTNKRGRTILETEGHRLVTVSLSPDDVQWLKKSVGAVKAAHGTTNRSLIIRAALRQLRVMIDNDPGKLMSYIQDGQTC